MALILIQNFFDDKIRSSQDVKEISNYPILGKIPYVKGKKSLSNMSMKRSLLAESLNSARTNLQYIATGQSKNVIAITSGISTEGKTFCSVNLAISLAQSGKKVILIDADMRRPRVGYTLNVRNTAGLSSYLINEVELGKAIINSGHENLDLILSGPEPPNPFELIELPKLGSMISMLETMYDYIIFDTPPLLLVSDFAVIAEHANVKLFVVRENFTKKQTLEQLVEAIKPKKLKGVGILLNGVRYQNSYGGGYGGYYEPTKQISNWNKVFETKAGIFLAMLLTSCFLLFQAIPSLAATSGVSPQGNDQRSSLGEPIEITYQADLLSANQ
jgi:capsular exopolysaccharide synthesis family protein